MARRVIRAERVHGPGEEREVVLTIANERLHGNGAVSNVYRAELLAPLQRTVAVKKMWLSKTSAEAAEREIALHRRLRHPCVIDLLYRFRLTVGEEACSPYQGTRYYRAPELCFGATSFTLSIDRWAAGCVLGELLVGRPLLCGPDAVDQGRVIVEVLGYPSGEQLRAMRVGRPRLVRRLIAGVDFPPTALELVRALLVCEPHLRPPAALVLGHAFFDQLRQFPPPCRLNGRPKTQSEHSAPHPSPKSPAAADRNGNTRTRWTWFW
ncbi:Protein kinase domain-containing protein [Aphelenchoides fujianensis]|nr:Protein kinase domain-containing protein [Aphelenchoides fujianensis]